MNTTKLSSKGQVIIPKSFRTAHHWEPGQELLVINTADGVLLKPRMPFLETNVDDVASCLQYIGKPKSLDDMKEAIKLGVKERFRDSD
jgi:AbrB family looped-hinge helix DNA binding protein